MRINALTVAAFVLVGCNRPTASTASRAPQVTAESHHGAANAAAAVVPSADGTRHFGAPMAAAAPRVRMTDIVNAPQQYTGQAVRVEGTVVAVCQAMGCWMEVRDEATQAHIRMHGHGFFVPRDANGHRAAVQATVVAAHPATECDREAQTATGQVAQLELDATGVELYQ